MFLRRLPDDQPDNNKSARAPVDYLSKDIPHNFKTQATINIKLS